MNSSTEFDSISIRRARDEDREALERLAGRDSAPTPSGAVLLAEVGGEPRAAIELASGTAVADPFHPTAELVDLLRARVSRLWEARRTTSRRATRRARPSACAAGGPNARR